MTRTLRISLRLVGEWVVVVIFGRCWVGKVVSWVFVCLLGTIVICEVKVRVYKRGGRSLEYKYIKKPRTLYSKLESE